MCWGGLAQRQFGDGATTTDSVAYMTTTQYPVTSSRQRMTLGAGTAMKIGFFGAFGAFLFMLIVYAIIGLIALVLVVTGSFDSLVSLFPN
jgi:hypothetical protein